MSLAQFGGGGGGSYLLSSDIDEGLGGSILKAPFIGERVFDDGPKTVCEFQMQIAGQADPKTWSAGKFAASLLVEALGADPAKWTYPVKGHFEYRPWKTSRSSGRSAHFIPDGFNGAKALAKNVATARTVMEGVPTHDDSAAPTKIDLQCPMCPSKFHGTNATAVNAALVSHLQSHEKAKKA